MTPIRISVVIPTYRRPDLLDRCLGALMTQDLQAGAYEILVADDAASEPARRLVEGWATRSPMAIRYLAVSGQHGPAAARNLGWRAARGEIVAFIDDDCVPEPRWLSEGLAALEWDRDAWAATGRVVVPMPDPPSDYHRNEAGLATAEFVTANCFVRRSALEAVGGFDERFRTAWREDSDLQFSLLERGGRIIRAPAAVVVHPVRPAPWGISLRQQSKSLFNALLYKKHPELYRRRIQRRPPWLYYAIVLAGLLAIAGHLAGSPLVGLLALAAWIVLTGRFVARRLRGTSHRPAHVAEMLATSVLIPPLSVFWRLYGAWKFRILFL